MKNYSKELSENFTLIELESFDDEQLLFPIEILKSLIRMREDEKKEDKRIENFWKNEYPNLIFEDKVKYWSGTLHRQMRWQEESGLDPYVIYEKNWYKETKAVEPNIDEIIDEVFRKYWSSTGGEWNKQIYLSRIKNE